MATKNLIVFDHPYGIGASENETHNRSLCAAIFKSVHARLMAQGEQVDVIDLIADGFNPVMSREDLVNWRLGKPMSAQVEDYQNRMKTCNRLIFIFPMYWELMPASTKGFIDKVYAKDIMYRSGAGRFGMQTLVPDMQVVAITPMASPASLYSKQLGEPLVKAMQSSFCIKTEGKSFRWIPIDQAHSRTFEELQAAIEGIAL